MSSVVVGTVLRCQGWWLSLQRVPVPVAPAIRLVGNVVVEREVSLVGGVVSEPQALGVDSGERGSDGAPVAAGRVGRSLVKQHMQPSLVAPCSCSAGSTGPCWGDKG